MQWLWSILAFVAGAVASYAYFKFGLKKKTEAEATTETAKAVQADQVKPYGEVPSAVIRCNDDGDTLLVTAEAIPDSDEIFLFFKLHLYGPGETPDYSKAQYTIPDASPVDHQIPYIPTTANMVRLWAVFALHEGDHVIDCYESSSSSSSSESSSSSGSSESSSSSGSSESSNSSSSD